MSDSPPHRVLAEFYDTERYEVLYDQYEALNASWKEIVEAGVESLAAESSVPSSDDDPPVEQPTES